MRVLFFGTYDVRAHPRVEVLRDGFRAAGDEVVECNVPLDLGTAARLRMLRQPWRLSFLGLRVLKAWLLLCWKARRVPRPDVVVVGYLGHLDVLLARLLFRRTPVALDYLVSLSDTAADRAPGHDVLHRALAAVDRAAVRAADVVAIDTEEQRVTLLAEPRSAAVVVPVGAPEWWYVPAPRPLPDEPLRVVFFGLYTPLQGTPVIGRALAALRDVPGIEVTMIGIGQDRAATQALADDAKNVTWIDWLEPDELADAVAAHHVCLGIFGTGEKARRVVPNKAYEGAAAGCAVLTSDTAPQRAAFGDAARYVPPGDADALAQALADLSLDPRRVATLRHAAHDVAVHCFRPSQVVTPLRASLVRR